MSEHPFIVSHLFESEWVLVARHFFPPLFFVPSLNNPNIFFLTYFLIFCIISSQNTYCFFVPLELLKLLTERFFEIRLKYIRKRPRAYASAFLELIIESERILELHFRGVKDFNIRLRIQGFDGILVQLLENRVAVDLSGALFFLERLLLLDLILGDVLILVLFWEFKIVVFYSVLSETKV